MASKTMVRIGDEVMWRGAWGNDPAKRVKVKHLEVTEHPGMKYGEDVKEVPWDTVRANKCLFTLDNGHWAYGKQIDPV